MTVEQFIKEMEEMLPLFEKNIKKLQLKERSILEWYEMFGNWSEITTDLMSEYYQE